MNTNKIISAIGAILMVLFLVPATTFAKKPNSAPVKAKFYDFSDQLIDGRVKKPHAIYTSVRQRVKFGRLLRIRRDFMGRTLQNTARDPVFK